MCLSGKTILHQNSPATELVLEWEKRKDKTTISSFFFSKCKIHLFSLCNLRYSHKYNLTDFFAKVWALYYPRSNKTGNTV